MPVFTVLSAVLIFFGASIAAETDKPKIAVNELKVYGMQIESAEIFSERLRTELVNSNAFRVMERAEMETILKEQGFQKSGACDESSCLIEVGQLLGVEKIVAGSVGKIGDVFSISVRIISVATSEILFTVSEDFEGTLLELLKKVIPAVALKLAGGNPAVEKETEPVKPAVSIHFVEIPPRSPSALSQQDCPGILDMNSLPAIKSVPFSKKDKNALAYFDFEGKSDTLTDLTGKHTAILKGAQRKAGVKGNGVYLSENSYVLFGSIIPDHSPEGTVELYVNFSSTFNFQGTYTIFGNRSSRLHLIYHKGTLYFQKNHPDKHIFLSKSIPFSSGLWYKIAISWGNKGMRLFINDKVVCSKPDTSGYSLERAETEDMSTLKAGLREWCCLEPLGIYDRQRSYWFDGTIDELIISSVQKN